MGIDGRLMLQLEILKPGPSSAPMAANTATATATSTAISVDIGNSKNASQMIGMPDEMRSVINRAKEGLASLDAMRGCEEPLVELLPYGSLRQFCYEKKRINLQGE